MRNARILPTQVVGQIISVGVPFKLVGFGLLITVACLGFYLTQATSPATTPKQPNLASRSDGAGLSFRGDNAPDSILYWHFLTSLYIDSVENNGARQRFLAPGVVEDSDTEWLFKYFVEQFLTLNHEIRQAKMDVLSCDNALDMPSGAGIFELIDALDDVEVAIYDKYLAMSAARFLVAPKYDIHTAIRNSPSSFEVSYPSRATLFGGHEHLGDVAVNNLCDALRQDFSFEIDPSDPDLIELLDAD